MSAFLYILLIGLLPLTHCYDSCEIGDINGQDNQICCNGEEYFVRNNPKWYQACNVEPLDENLSYEDTIFLAYDCHVRKWLGKKSLTIKTYATLMSQMSYSKKNPIWTRLTPNDTVIEAKDERERIQTIKALYNDYLRAIREVCLYSGKNAQTMNEDEITEKMQQILIYTEEAPCRNGSVPNFLVTYYQYLNDYDTSNTVALRKCKEEIKNWVGDIKSDRLYKNATRVCLAVHYKNLKMGDVKRNFDFENITSNFFPKFWSKATTKLARNMILHSLKQTYGNDKKLRDCIRLMKAEIELQIDEALYEDEQVQNRNALVNAFIADRLYVIFWPIRDYGMCYFGNDYANQSGNQNPPNGTAV